MTARRRRKSGSGPSATALIAWVGARQAAIDAPLNAPVAMIQGGHAPRMPRGRAVLVGRACGVAAGTLLACGSVLASATHVGDGSLAGNSAPLPNRAPVALGAGNPDGYRADAPTDSPPAAPELVSAQTVADNSPALHPRLGQVRRNNPVSVDTPVAAPSRQAGTDQRPWTSPAPAAGQARRSPIAPVAPVLDPATNRVGRVAPVGGVLAPANPSGQQTHSLGDEPAAGPRAEQSGPSTKQSGPATSQSGPATNGAVSRDAVASVRQVVGPVSNAVQPAVQSVTQPATQPAMAMLTSLLPKG
jgi:hypothetical protein